MLSNFTGINYQESRLNKNSKLNYNIMKKMESYLYGGLLYKRFCTAYRS